MSRTLHCKHVTEEQTEHQTIQGNSSNLPRLFYWFACYRHFILIGGQVCEVDAIRHGLIFRDGRKSVELGFSFPIHP